MNREIAKATVQKVRSANKNATKVDLNVLKLKVLYEIKNGDQKLSNEVSNGFNKLLLGLFFAVLAFYFRDPILIKLKEKKGL